MLIAHTFPRFFLCLLLSLSTLKVLANPLEVLEISERTFDNSPALTLIFSHPLDATQLYNDFLTVHIEDQGQSIAGSWVVAENPHQLYFLNTLPETTYTVTVLAGLPAANGQKLPQPVTKTITTEPLPPAFGFASQGLILPAELSSGLPIITVNVEAVDLEFFQVLPDKLVSFVTAIGRNSSKSYWELDEFHPFADSVYLGRFNTNAQPNKRTVTHIPVETIKELMKPGLYVTVMKLPGRYDDQYQTAFFFISDIGLHARRYQQRFEIYATSLRTGQPLANVTLTLYTAESTQQGPFAKTFTNAQGHSFFEFFPDNAHLLTAQHNNHISFLFLNDPALDLSEFTLAGARSQALELFVYMPRNLYRPGEQLQFSALLRDEDGQTVTNLPLHAKLKRPDGREVHEFIWQSQSSGYYSKTFDLPKDASTGNWSLEVYTDPTASLPTQVHRFKVETFLPERLKLNLHTEQATLAPKENFNIQVMGEYLYGSPAAGNRITANLQIVPEPHPLELFPDFHFGREDALEKYQENWLEDSLDGQGLLEIQASPLADSETAIAPLNVKASVSIYETGGRPVTRSLQRNLWPAAQLIGIHPLFELQEAPEGGTLEFEVIKTNPQGELLAANDLQVKLVHEDRDYYWRYTQHEGWQIDFQTKEYPLHRLNLNIPIGQKGHLSLPVQFGNYRLEILDPDTQLTTQLRFKTAWYGDENTKGVSRPDKVSLRLNQAAYRPGDTIELTILPPHAGYGLVTVENRERALWSNRLPIAAEGTVVKIPVAADWQSHDLYVSAVVFRPGDTEEKMTPKRAVGIVHLPLDRKDRQLALQVAAPSKIEPETQLPVKISVGNKLPGETVKVTVAAVDVGVLNITDFVSPDPYAYFFAKRRYGIDMYDLYGQVIENLPGVTAKLRFGGDAALNSGRLAEAKITIVSLFTGPVTVDQQGQAEVLLDIPDFNGRLRIMAVAFSEQRFAGAETEVTVVAPIVAEPAFPRFLAAGDQSTLTLDVHNLSGQTQAVQLHMRATPPLVMDEFGQPLTLVDQQKLTLRLPLGAQQAFGVGKLQLQIKGDVNLQRTWELSVRPPYPSERRVWRQQLLKGTPWKWEKDWIKDLIPSSVQVGVVLAETPPINTQELFGSLLRYPYGCLEQTTSRAYPLLYVTEEIAKHLKLETWSPEKRQAALESAFTRLAGMQKTNGGFGLWDSQSPEELWLTPYVLNFLLDAQEQGIDIPEHVLERGLKRILESLQSSPSQFKIQYESGEHSPHAQLAAKAFAGYVLARLNRAPLGSLRTLYEQQAKQAISPLPWAHLGLALYLQGDKTRGLAALEKALGQPFVHNSGYRGDYGSYLRDIAWLLHSVNKHGISIKGLENVWWKIDEQLNRTNWLSTQEQNALLLASLPLLIPKESATEQAVELSLEGKHRVVRFKQRWQAVFDETFIRLGMELSSKQSLYSELIVSGYPRQAPAVTQEKGWRLQRHFYSLKGQKLAAYSHLPEENGLLMETDEPSSAQDRQATGPVQQIKSGELVVAMLTLKTGDRGVEQGLLIDWLPAGLELENPHLVHSETLEGLEIEEVEVQKVLEELPDEVQHQEYLEDRFVTALRLGPKQVVQLFYLARAVTPGTYKVPPPYFEDMYQPSLRVVGEGAGQLQVDFP